MHRTLGATIGKVVSKPSPFGRSLVEVSRPIAFARAVQFQAVLDRLGSSNPQECATRGKETTQERWEQRVRDLDRAACNRRA
jgi:hypothetical protein